MGETLRVRRENIEARTRTLKNGTVEEYPAYHICRYYYGDKEIARYSSLDDVMRLRTEYIKKDFSLSYYERAMQCELSEAYKYLFYMLNVNESSSLGEYMLG